MTVRVAIIVIIAMAIMFYHVVIVFKSRSLGPKVQRELDAVTMSLNIILERLYNVLVFLSMVIICKQH